LHKQFPKNLITRESPIFVQERFSSGRPHHPALIWVGPSRTFTTYLSHTIVIFRARLSVSYVRKCNAFSTGLVVLLQKRVTLTFSPSLKSYRIRCNNSTATDTMNPAQSSNKIFKPNNGVHIPALGFGTWKSTTEDAYESVKTALQAGYRHIDTAFVSSCPALLFQATCHGKKPHSQRIFFPIQCDFLTSASNLELRQ
jgi:hypothetical protein